MLAWRTRVQLRNDSAGRGACGADACVARMVVWGCASRCAARMAVRQGAAAAAMRALQVGCSAPRHVWVLCEAFTPAHAPALHQR